MEYIFFYDSPLGQIGIGADEVGITDIYFVQSEKERLRERKETPLIKEAGKQLAEYFSGERKEFNFPLHMKGTKFQVSVWEALLNIPYGETRSYKDIAIAVGNEKACRAVGLANNKNPIVIAVPCHRVIGANGTLVGYGGGLHIKENLLQLEGVVYKA